MASTYWIEESLAGTLPTLWMFLGVGLPWALASLSRQNWHSKALIAAVAFALGPALTAAWMLALGVAGAQLEQRLLKPETILLGSAVIASCGCLIAWRKRHASLAARARGAPFEFDEKLIVFLIAIAVALRWVHTAFWPFTAYDALWVFGYQGRLFFLEGMIPNAIDYYPPFLSLQFAYVQTLIGGINDHAARMVLPMLHIGSILAAYLLGARLANRRAGLIAAALWGLHPYVSQWAVIGDLEIPLTFSVTLASAFFLRAWTGELEPRERRREAVLAGVMLGIALFTKPTAGAFIWGVLLLLAVDLISRRFDFRAWLPRFRLAIWTGLACIPLGGIWYLRNLALGHDAVTLPKAVWLTRALRNGDFLAPLALAAIVTWFALALGAKAETWRCRAWRDWRPAAGGGPVGFESAPFRGACRPASERNFSRGSSLDRGRAGYERIQSTRTEADKADASAIQANARQRRLGAAACAAVFHHLLFFVQLSLSARLRDYAVVAAADSGRSCPRSWRQNG